jgi:hypothetical protein
MLRQLFRAVVSMAVRFILLLVALHAAGLLVACGAPMKAGTEDCPMTPTDVRDPDVQALIDQFGPAQDAAFSKRQGARLSGLSIFLPPLAPGQVAPPQLVYFSAAQQDKPALAVSFSNNTPLVREMVVVPKAQPPLTELSDLSVGPARAMQATVEKYPDARLTALGLSRHDCQLEWHAGAFMDNTVKSITVNNQGQVLRLEDAPLAGR